VTYITYIGTGVMCLIGSCKTWPESGLFGLCQAKSSWHNLG